MALKGREMRSRIDSHGILTISLEWVEIPAPADDEVVVRIEATPSELGSGLVDRYLEVKERGLF